MKRCLGCKEQIENDVIECNYCGFSQKNQIEGYFLQPGTKLAFDRYEIGNVLGQGGFGITYLAWDMIGDKKVSIKEYFPSEFSARSEGKSEISIYTGDRERAFRDGMKCFVDEARKLAVFSEIEGIIKIYECFEENNTAYIVMEYCDGESLDTLLKREKRIELGKAIELLVPVMKSLEKVHKEGIIHRDISPDNIFITKSGSAKLLDFGSARQLLSKQSKSLTVIIKDGYSPEEQYSSHGNQGTWTDVYAMAATIYMMITGEKPMDAVGRRSETIKKKKDNIDMSFAHTKEEKVVLAAINHAMRLDIEKRTGNMQDFINELSGEAICKNKMCINTRKALIVASGILVLSVIAGCVILKMNFNTDNKEKVLLKKDKVESVADKSKELDNTESSIEPVTQTDDMLGIETINPIATDVESTPEASSNNTTKAPAKTKQPVATKMPATTNQSNDTSANVNNDNNSDSGGTGTESTIVSTEKPVIDFEYTISNNKAIISKYIGTGGNVSIPSSIEGYSVSSIAESTFAGCTSVSSVEIPNSVKSIGNKAFYNCSSMTSIKIYSSVNSLGSNVFDGCSVLINYNLEYTSPLSFANFVKAGMNSSIDISYFGANNDISPKLASYYLGTSAYNGTVSISEDILSLNSTGVNCYLNSYYQSRYDIPVSNNTKYIVRYDIVANTAKNSHFVVFTNSSTPSNEFQTKDGQLYYNEWLNLEQITFTTGPDSTLIRIRFDCRTANANVKIKNLRIFKIN